MEEQPPPPPLLEELVEEILFRFPPDDPRSLVRALVCRSWCRLVSCPGFNRRFREFHNRTSWSSPPTLGFLCTVRRPSSDDTNKDGTAACLFMPLTPSFHRLPHALMPNWRPVDARRGRVLFSEQDWKNQGRLDESAVSRLHFVVWNPMTGETSRLPSVPMYKPMLQKRWTAALVCDDDHGAPFRVVFVATFIGITSVCIYSSSEQHVWSAPISAEYPGYFRVLEGCNNNALVGSALYFNFYPCRILQFDMSKLELSLISMPPRRYSRRKRIVLMTTEDGGGLGFAVEHMYKFYTWSREVGPDGAGTWVQQRVFELDKMFPYFTPRRMIRAVAVDNTLSAVFIGTYNSLFVIDLKFARARKIYEYNNSPDGYLGNVVPYATFCTPVVWSGLYR